MQVGTYTCSTAEEARISEIYERLVAVFPNAKYVNRGNILGIGEAGYHLFCYLVMKENGLVLKFKNQNALPISDANAIAAALEAVIQLFKNEDLRLGVYHPQTTPKTERSPRTPKRREKKRTAPPLLNTEAEQEKLRFIQSHQQMFCPVFHPSLLEQAFDTDRYHSLWLEVISHLCEAAKSRLRPQEQAFFFARFGINETAKTLQEIGDLHHLSRERVRQALVKGLRRLGSTRISNATQLDLEYERVRITTEIAEANVSGFLLFLLLSEAKQRLVELICTQILHTDVDLSAWQKQLREALDQKKLLERAKEREDAFRARIYNAIIFPQKRKIADEDFARLSTQRIVNREEPALRHFTFAGTEYQCESFAQQHILEKLLLTNTFRSIKTQSLVVPVGTTFWYPDFQCLTHDGHLVLIDIKRICDMCEHQTRQKIKALEAFCHRYGFGYLVMDARGNSFAQITEENRAFSGLMLQELARAGSVTYPKFKELAEQTHASYKHLLALIKAEDLRFTFYPFLLSRAPVSQNEPM